MNSENRDVHLGSSSGLEVTALEDSWICPWGICNHQQAQACRADTSLAKRYGAMGCGGRFPPDTTPEQAKKLIAPKEAGLASGTSPALPPLR